jgi:putative transcriptional regulator
MRNNIRRFRKVLKFRQMDLAESLGISRQTVIAIENGKHLPNLELAFKLAELFHCKVDDLFKQNT